jgi:OOP family OmpA-OmpF porin
MNTYKILIFVLSLSFFSLFSGDLTAGIRTGEMTLTNQIGMYKFENSQNLEDALSFGVGLGYNMTKHWALEGSFTYINTDSKVETGRNIRGQLYRLDGLYHLMPEKRLVPFVSAGIGLLNITNANATGEDKDQRSLLFNYGAGIMYSLSRFIILRSDIRHILALDDTKSNFLVTLGLTFVPAGIAAREVIPKPVLQPPPSLKDSDSDGVSDDRDRCPHTRIGVSVDSSGCPPDSDSDGIPDHLDACPDTPAGVAVYSTGCPEDSDSDNVPDHRDECPDTPQGIVVDATGCKPPVEKAKVITFEDIYFEFKQTALTEEAQETLKKNIQILKENPEVRVLIEGHACAHGPEELNLRISRERAEIVMEYLVQEGIERERLSMIGYGESRLAMPEIPTPENKNSVETRANRRVHFEVITPEKDRKKILSQIRLRFYP